MSLDKRVVTVPLVDGLSDNDDNFASDPPGWISIGEVRWSRDKQIGKRNGVALDVAHGSGTQAAIAKAPNSIVDMDGVPHLLTADGTLRRDPIFGSWSYVNASAPRPSRLVSDPLVRVNDTTNKSDVAVAGNTACAVWEVIKPAGTVPVVYYGFWDISGDVPRPLAPPVAVVGNAPRVVALASRYFVMTWIDLPTGARHIQSAAYDTTAGTYTFGGTIVLDAIGIGGSNQYALGTSADLTSYAIVSYLTGATNQAKKLDNTGTATATIALTAMSGAQHVIHNSAISKIVVIDGTGTVQHFADTFGGVGTVITPFTAPPSGRYAGQFFRATIGLFDATGRMLIARSTAGPHGTALAGPMGAQVAVLDTAFAVLYDGVNVLGGIAIAGHCSPFITRTACCYFAVSHESAYYTADQDPTTTTPTVSAFRAAPVAYVVRAYVDTHNAMQLAAVGRYGQDAIELLGNAAVGTPVVSTGTSHLPHMAYDPSATDPRLVTAYPARMADFLGGTLGTFKRGVDIAQCWPHTTTPARNVNAQALRIIGCGHGTSSIDGNEHVEMTPEAPQWLEISGSDAASVGNAYPVGAGSHIDTTGTPWGGGPNPNKQWGFCVVWRYVDARGALHRSAPSSVYYALYAELVGGGGEAAKLVFEPWRPMGLLGERGTTPEIEVYAAPYDAPGDFRLLGIVTPVPDTTVDEGRVYVALTNGGTPLAYSVGVTATWDAKDPRNATPRQLYTTALAGSGLAATPSPALLSICSTQSRLWGLSGEDRLDVWYTKPIALGYAPEWSDTLRVRVPQDGGPSVAIAAIDDKVVVFKRTKVFVIEGDGGDASGNSSSLRTPRLVSSDVGCDSVESVVEGPFGIIFHSERGFMVLGRDLTYNFIGAPVMDQLTPASSDGVSRIVVSSCIIPSETEVRFATKTARSSNAGLGLAWNYRLNRWTRRSVTVLPVAFNANVGGVEWFDCFHTSNGSDIYKETPYVWTYAPFQQSMQSSWVKLNGIAGYGRVWRAVFVFKHYGDANTGTGITITCSADYTSALDVTRAWSPADLAALQDSSGRIELSVKPLTQKCEAIQFNIAETDDAKLDTGRGFDLIGVTLEVGVKRGAYKRLPAAARK